MAELEDASLLNSDDLDGRGDASSPAPTKI